MTNDDAPEGEKEDAKRELSDRLRDRFDTGPGSETDSSQEPQSTSGEERQQDETPSKNAKNSMNAMQAKNVKEDWNATSIYLPEFLDRRLTTTYKHADIGYEEEFGQSLQKTRYYYPLVVQLGMERIESMESQELKECIERLEDEASESV